MAYELEGTLLEVCTCNILCPCWVGEDPDGGTCEGVLGWHIERGSINGIDVSGRSLVIMAHIPGNVLKGGWTIVAYLDDGTTDEQQQAILDVWTGKLGGPVADLAGLVGQGAGVERVPIAFEVREGKGTLMVGDRGSKIDAELAPFQGATGVATALHDTVFTTIPGSPAYVGKASHYKANVPQLDLTVDLHGHNAVQGSFRFVAA
jgi:hypothetical protein